MKAEFKEITTELVKQLRRIGAAAERRLPAPVKDHSKTIAGVAGVGILAVALMAAFAIYVLGWQNAATITVSRFLPYPAGFVGGEAISYRDYARRANAIRPNGQEANLQAFGELVNNALIRRLAKRADITVPVAEVERQVALDMNVRGGEKAALAEVKQAYGLDKRGYANKVELGLLRLELESWLAADPENQQHAKGQADHILEQAKGGASFDDLVQRYSSILASSRQAVSTLPAEAQNAVLGVEPGNLVDRSVLAGESYYVLKRLSDDGQAYAQVIVVRPRNLSQWLADELTANAPIKLLPQIR